MDYKIGDIILLNEPFNFKNINTWLNPFVKFFINLWHKARGKQFVNYSHLEIIGVYNGQLCTFGAMAAGFVKTGTAAERLKNIDNLILRPAFNFDEQNLNDEILNLIGTPYDFEGVFRQIPYRAFAVTWRDINPEAAKKNTYCTEAGAYLLNKVSGRIPDWQKWAQPEFYFSNLFIHIKTT